MSKRPHALRLGLAAVVLALAAAPFGCGRKGEQKAAPMASLVRMGDRRLERQLAAGFYGIEANAWRWSKKEFSVVLRTPDRAAQRGGRLQARFTVPDVIIAKLGAVTLSAGIAGQALPPQTWDAAGARTYTRDVPAGLLTGDSVRVDFSLDKAMPPSGGDLRELGIVVMSIGLEAK